MVPVTLGFLNKTEYGLWLTIFAFLNWSNVFDLGINNGLKSKLIYAFSKGDMHLAKREISTTYSIMLVFAMLLIFCFLVASYFINWNAVFDYPQGTNLKLIVVLPMVLFLLKLYTDIIYAVLLADQRTGLFNFLYLLINVFSLLGVYLLSKLEVTEKLLTIAILLSVIPLAVSIVCNVYFFSSSYRSIRPTFLKFDASLIKSTISQGLKFFIIQLAVLVLLSTDNFIIIHLFSPADVTNYGICYKFFTLFTLGWTTIILPYWSAFGDAFYRSEIEWIKRTVRKLILLWVALNLLLAVTLLFINPIYILWVGNTVTIPYSLSIATAVFISIFSLSNIFNYFINGIGKIQVSLITYIIMGMLNIPLSILLAKGFNLGSTGVMLGTCLCLLINPFVGYIQYKKIIDGRAQGVWFR